MGLRKFIITCLKFLLAIILICGLSLLFNSAYIKIRGYKIKPQQNILVLGDSHTEYAIDDTILTNSINLSHSADSYFYSHLKVKRMKQENPQLDTLILAFSNHNLLSQYDERWLLNPLHIKSKFRIYADLMDFSDFGFFLKSKPLSVLQGIMETPKYSIKLLLKGELKERDLGSFIPSERNKLVESIERFKKNSNKRKLEYSKIEKRNFFNIINFCKKNNITVILVSTPIHKVYLDNEDKIKEFQLLSDFYDSNLSDITFLDYSFYDIPDSFYQDINHLNRKGAQKFTEQLMNDIKINSYIHP